MNVSDFLTDENTFCTSFFLVLKKVHKIRFSILGFPVIIMVSAMKDIRHGIGGAKA